MYGLSNIVDEDASGKSTVGIVVEDILISFKYALMQLNITPTDIRGTLFKEFGGENKISVYELMKIITRITKKSKEQTEKLAQYLIEQTDKYQEADIEIVCNKLCNLLGNYTIPSESLRPSIAKVISIINNRN